MLSYCHYAMIGLISELRFLCLVKRSGSAKGPLNKIRNSASEAPPAAKKHAKFTNGPNNQCNYGFVTFFWTFCDLKALHCNCSAIAIPGGQGAIL